MLRNVLALLQTLIYMETFVKSAFIYILKGYREVTKARGTMGDRIHICFLQL